MGSRAVSDPGVIEIPQPGYRQAVTGRGGVQEIVIGCADGERLAATLYLPEGDGPFAALLEALPYRKDDVTESYRSTYERYAAAGFAVLRLDLRGTGSSTGIATDEYTDAERADLHTVIDWLATQPWSSGKVGMFGTSYSGFNSLHMAAEANPALGAVVAIYATDDRYTDDVHYAGGVLRALDLIDYPLYMVAMNALPPVPSVFGDEDGRSWRDEWRRRIDATPAWLMEWLSNAIDGPTWRRGSIRLGPDGAGYERMGCPTMIIAGWADGYRNNTFRVIEQYERNGLPWRLLAGPWVHKSPASARPGPNVDDDVEIIAFFDEHLRGGSRVGRRERSGLRPAAGRAGARPGVPSRGVARHRPPGRPMGSVSASSGRIEPESTSLVVRGDVGVAAWNSCGGGLPWGQPLDQRDDDARSITYDWPIVGAGRRSIGNGTVALRVRSDQRYGHVSVKLCDVFPDGTSALITRSMLDLTHAGCWPADERGEVGRSPRALTPGEWIDIEIVLEATTWTLVPGHVLRLSVAGTDWPNCWPPPGPVTLEVDAGAVVLSLPIVDGLAETAHQFTPGTGPSADEATASRGGSSTTCSGVRPGSSPATAAPIREPTGQRSPTTTAASSACRRRTRPTPGRVARPASRSRGRRRPCGPSRRSPCRRTPSDSTSRSGWSSGTATRSSPGASGPRRCRVDRRPAPVPSPHPDSMTIRLRMATGRDHLGERDCRQCVRGIDPELGAGVPTPRDEGRVRRADKPARPAAGVGLRPRVIAGRGCAGLQVEQHARRPVLAADVLELWIDLVADVDAGGTPGVEPTAPRDGGRVGRLTVGHQGHVPRTAIAAGYGCHQRFRVRMLRVGGHVARRAFLDDPAEVHHADAIGVPGRRRQVVGDHQDAHPVAAQLGEHFEHARPAPTRRASRPARRRRAAPARARARPRSRRADAGRPRARAGSGR